MLMKLWMENNSMNLKHFKGGKQLKMEAED